MRRLALFSILFLLVGGLVFTFGLIKFFSSRQTTYTSYADQQRERPRPQLGETLIDAFTNFFDEPSYPPTISAKSAIVYDIDSRKIIFEKSPTLSLPMASLTKIMTAIIALENKKPDDIYYVSQGAMVGENSMGLTPGEIVSLDDLLHGLFLLSGNDAAEVLAQNFPGGREEFLAEMNVRAKEIGAKNTKFSNASGLQGDGEQYTTAEDLVRITYYGLSNFPEFGKVSQTITHTIPQTKNHKYFSFSNETNLLTSYPGVKGVKTGYTPEAGYCLVTYLEYKGKRFVGVLLGSENRRQEMKDLLDYSLTNVGVTPPKHE